MSILPLKEKKPRKSVAFVLALRDCAPALHHSWVADLHGAEAMASHLLLKASEVNLDKRQVCVLDDIMQEAGNFAANPRKSCLRSSLLPTRTVATVLTLS